MKLAIVCLLATCALVAAVAPPKVADRNWLSKEKDLLLLFNYVHQPSYYKEFKQISESFKWDNWSQWTKPEYAKEFWYWYQNEDVLPQGEIFSVFYPEHLEQAIALFRSFYYAKDYETMYKIGVWARQNVNEGMFVYAFSVAVIHSQWTQELILPPIHETWPEYFFSEETMNKAQQYKQHYWGTYEHEDEIKDASYKGYTIQSNYTGWYMNVHPEQSMTYFTEDVGINAYYWYSNLYMPWWMPKSEMQYGSDATGEHFYYQHQQLLAKYYLERLSNGFGEIPNFEYEYPIEQGYYPSLTYPNGMKFPSRPNHASLYYHGAHGQQSYLNYGNYTWSYTYVKDYERRLRDAVDRGYFWTHDGKLIDLYDENGIEILGNMVESNGQNPNDRFYGDLQLFSRHLLGYSYFPLDQYKIAPSAMEHFETSLRDPAFWMLYKRMMSYFQQYQSYDGPYEKKELDFNGVSIEDVSFERMYTFFDYFYSDISNGVVVDEKEFENNSFEVRARQYRLNHKPFNYKIAVTSEQEANAFVKIFLGPKYDEYGRELHITENWMNFVELDRFHYKLTAGKNVIDRSSKDAHWANDYTTYNELLKNVMNAYNGGEPFKYYSMEKYYSLPHRFMLPKGVQGGQTFQVYVMISPSKQGPADDDLGWWYKDADYSLGWPLDKPVVNEYEFNVTNSYFTDVTIYHKNVHPEINPIWSNVKIYSYVYAIEYYK